MKNILVTIPHISIKFNRKVVWVDSTRVFFNLLLKGELL